MSTSTFSKFLPWISLAVGSSALGFQIVVLYPWHIRLEKDFVELEKKQEDKLFEFHLLKVNKLEQMDQKLNKVIELQRRSSKSSWWWS
jgi:hypothetical protein